MQNEARLPDLIERVDNGLDSNKNWSELLSHGEQQRIAFARVFLQKPSIVLCDESTSAVDENTEMKLYSHLAVVVPTIISIAHRSSLAKFHNHTLTYNSTYDSKWKRGHIMWDDEEKIKKRQLLKNIIYQKYGIKIKHSFKLNDG